MYIHTGNLVSRVDLSNFSFIDFFFKYYFFLSTSKGDMTKMFPIFSLFKNIKLPNNEDLKCPKNCDAKN